MRATEPVRVEVWSDVQCVWCYIAGKRLQNAIDRFGGDVQLMYRSFVLNPDAPVDVDRDAQQRHHQASNPRFEQIMTQLRQLTAAEGLGYRPDLTLPTNSRSAMELLHLAGETGQRPAMMRRLFQAYFVDGRHLGEVGELARIATDLGFDANEVATALNEGRFRSAVEADDTAARRLGATGAPFYTVDDRWGLAGAQSADTYLELLNRAAQA